MKEDALLSPTLVDLLRLRASDQGDDIAYYFLCEDGSRESMTYAQLDAAVDGNELARVARRPKAS